MTIFGYRIERRFWIIIGSIALVVIGLIVISGRSSDPSQQFLTEPAFPVSELSDLANERQFLTPYVEAYGLNEPESVEPFFSLTQFSGAPFKARVLIPPRDEAQSVRSDLVFSANNWEFTPAIFLTPDVPLPPSALQEKVSELESGRPLLLAFPAGQLRAEGQAEVTGLLYGHSQMIRPTADGTPTPVLLVSSARPLNPVELANPATNRADLGITYLQGRRLIEVRNVEWSSGRQIRMCLKISNRGNLPIDAWAGGGGLTGSYTAKSGQQGTFPAQVDELSTLASSEALPPQESVEGYLFFEQPPLAGPEERLRLVIPDFDNPDVPRLSTTIQVSADQFAPVAESDKAAAGRSTGGCLS
jgi:hypothetical protein